VTSVEWSVRALDDFDALVAYLAARSPQGAATLVTAITRKVDVIATFPRGGYLLGYRHGTPYRDVFVREWRLVYAISDTKLIVVAILHGRQNIDPVQILQLTPTPSPPEAHGGP
jgi:plasmid stabilization system protein ParE